MTMDTSDFKEKDEFYIQALLLAEVVKRILEKQADIILKEKPALTKKPITEFCKRMRISSVGKFDGKTYISTINFYETEEDLQGHTALGALILYIKEDYVFPLFQKLNYPDIDETDEEAIEDACGTFCNLVAGNFKSGLTQLGYKELFMSHFSSYQNDILNGVEYHPDEKELYEVSIRIRDEVCIILDLTMGPIPKIENGLNFSYF